MKISNKNKGVLCIFGAALCFSLMSLMVRLAGDLPTFEKAMARNLVAMFIAAGTLIKNGEPVHVPRGARIDLLMRVLFGTAGIILNFYAISYLNLADANMLNKLSPFWAIVCSYFVLREKCSPVQILLMLGAFVGAVLIVKPTGSNIQLVPALAGLAGGAAAGTAYTFLRKTSQKGVKGTVIVFCFSAFSLVVMLPMALANFIVPTPAQTAALLMTGAAAAGGQFFITAAYSFAPAREISVYDYTQVIFSALLGFVFFSQIPDMLSIIGYIIIITMGVQNFLYNKRQYAAAAAVEK